MIYSERLQVFLHAMERPDGYDPDETCPGRPEENEGIQEDALTGRPEENEGIQEDALPGRPEENEGIQEDALTGRPDRDLSRELCRARFFESMRLKAEAEGVPIIRREMESFLQVLLTLKEPQNILEVGSAVGYSAMRMASYTSDDVMITTIEKDALRAAQARSNFQKSEWADRITLIEGDAMEILETLQDEAYEYIFMDAAKGQYIHFLPQILRVLKTGGVLVSDNVLQDGMILQPHTAVDPRDRTIYQRMRTYLRVLKRTDGLLTTIVPIGDGASVTIKRKEICIDRENYLNY